MGFEPHHLGTEVDAVVVQSDHREYADLRPEDVPGARLVVNGRPGLVIDFGGEPEVVVVGIGRRPGVTGVPGRGLMPGRIHLSKADVTTLEEEYVVAAIRSGWCAPLGPDVDAFEAEVAAFVGVGHALALSSGSAALHLALLEVGAAPERVVVLPTMTFAATANAVAYTGATPVFVDALADDANIDPQLLVEAVDRLRSEGADVCAVVTVDLFGRACDYASIEPALAERGVPLVEDAAEALGASRDGRSAAAFGRVSALSFNGNKIMTTSGGGMLLSDDGDLVEHARKLSTQAREPFPWYEHAEVGYNYRLSNLLAAFGRAQLRRLPAMIERRRGDPRALRVRAGTVRR